MEENKYWFLHPGLLTDYAVFLYSSLLLVYGYVINAEAKKLIKVIIVSVLLFSCFGLIFNNFSLKRTMFMHSYKFIKNQCT